MTFSRDYRAIHPQRDRAKFGRSIERDDFHEERENVKKELRTPTLYRDARPTRRKRKILRMRLMR